MIPCGNFQNYLRNREKEAEEEAKEEEEKKEEEEEEEEEEEKRRRMIVLKMNDSVSSEAIQVEKTQGISWFICYSVCNTVCFLVQGS
jgi:CO dehydrogenase/acetyl-CoA synthase beta subunit